MKHHIGQAAEADIEEVSGRMRLVHGRIETLQREGEVDRIDVVQIVAAESEAGQPGGGDQRGKVAEFQIGDLPASSTAASS